MKKITMPLGVVILGERTESAVLIVNAETTKFVGGKKKNPTTEVINLSIMFRL